MRRERRRLGTEKCNVMGEDKEWCESVKTASGRETGRRACQ